MDYLGITDVKKGVFEVYTIDLGLKREEHILLCHLYNRAKQRPNKRDVMEKNPNIAKALGVSIHTIRRHLKKLQEKGFIELSNDIIIVTEKTFKAIKDNDNEFKFYLMYYDMLVSEELREILLTYSLLVSLSKTLETETERRTITLTNNELCDYIFIKSTALKKQLNSLLETGLIEVRGKGKAREITVN